MITDTTIRLLDIPADATLEQTLRACREIVEDCDFPTVKRWREAGGRVVGHFQVYFPEELAHAAGALPVKVRGAPVDRQSADSHFGSYLCSVIRSSLEIALTNRLQVDMFVTHPICDAARNLAGVWSRNLPQPAQILFLPQNANSAAAVGYLRQEYARVLAEIEAMTGHQVERADIENSIAVFNRNRELMRQLYEIKREAPWLLSVDEAYVLVSIGGLITRDEHNELLQRVLPQIASRTARKTDKMRVVFEGGFCEQPPLDLLRAIAQFCYVVDDDLLIGMRWLLTDVPTHGDAIFNLADAYINGSSYSPVQHDRRKPKEKMLIERVRNARASAAIIAAAKMCEPGLDEQVAYAKTLETEAIPFFITEFEEHMTSFDHLQIQLETFVETLLFD